MSAIESGAFANATPWHNLGTKVENGFISPAEFMKEAGMDWKVKKEDLFLSDGTKVDGSQVTRRMSDNKILGVVGNRYHILQNEEVFNWFAPFIESRSASFETAGSLKDGKVVWVLAKTNIEGDVVKGDKVDSYILLSHSHDGTLTIRSGFTPIRVVCCNTLTAAHNSASSKLLKVRHTKSASITLEKVREIMDVAQLDFKASMKQYKFLASKAVSKKTLEQYVKVVLGKEEDSDEKEMRQSTIEKVQLFFEQGKGHQYGAGSAWNLYNAMTEYLTWEKGRNASNRLHSLWFGQDVKTNMKALEVATKIAEGMDI